MDAQTVVHHRNVVSSLPAERSFTAPRLYLPQSTNPMDSLASFRSHIPFLICWKSDLFQSDGIVAYIGFPRTNYPQATVFQSPELRASPKEKFPDVSRLPAQPRIKKGLDLLGGWNTLIDSSGYCPPIGMVHRPGSTYIASLIGINRNDRDVIPIAIVFSQTNTRVEKHVRGNQWGIVERKTIVSTKIRHK